MRAPAFARVVVFAIAPCAARADERPIAVGAALAYAFPAGSLERGARASDATFGAPLLRLDGAYRIAPAVSLGGAMSYGATIPTLCVTASDCTSSLGHLVDVVALARWHLGVWQRFEPTLDAGLGYEWLTTAFSDRDASSRRGHRGFTGSIGADASLRVAASFTLGLHVETLGGVAHRASLTAPGVDTSSPTDGSTLHAWAVIGARAAGSF